jgi:spectinomycin phosphotransferase
MRDDLGLDLTTIAACLEREYGLRVDAIRFLPIGFDASASVYEVVDAGGACFFLKVRAGPVNEPGLIVPRSLIDAGVPNILAPMQTRMGTLWCELDGDDGTTVVLSPFMRGENAMVAGLSDDQWRTFGSTLRAVHDRGLTERIRGLLPVERFALPSAALVNAMSERANSGSFDRKAAARLADLWRANQGRIDAMLSRAEELGRALQSRSFEMVLCHADIHAANLLAGDDGRIWLIDWDGPMIAPRERDFLFVVGSRIAREVTLPEEALFFEGYGATEIDPASLIYYRYERIIEDLGEFGKSVFLNSTLSDAAMEEEVELAMSFFVPEGDIDRAEVVSPRGWLRFAP